MIAQSDRLAVPLFALSQFRGSASRGRFPSSSIIKSLARRSARAAARASLRYAFCRACTV